MSSNLFVRKNVVRRTNNLGLVDGVVTDDSDVFLWWGRGLYSFL